MRVETRSAEVVVVGGGGAGLTAALEARRAGADVLLLSKTVLGGGSCTTLSLGAFRVADTPEARQEHLSQSLAAGKGLNDRALLEILVDQAFGQVRKLEEYGVPILHEPPYINVIGKAPAYGLAITAPLQNAVAELGIPSMGQTVAIDLMKSNGAVCGLLAYTPQTDTLSVISARAVVLATGGAGALYPLHDNSPRTTGDGFAMSARAGAALRDMEFVQFYPLGLVEGGVYRCIVPPWLGNAGTVRNTLGEDILAKYRIEERPAAVKSRDAFSQAMYREIAAGRGFGPCLELDITRVDDRVWDQSRQLQQYRPILHEKFPGLERPLRIAPVCHHFMGGVLIDGRCATTLPGLFASGESAGGVHGANRMGGNALSECVVFGSLAGREAAACAATTGRPSVPPGPAEEAARQVGSWTEKGPGLSPRELKRRLAQIMFANAGIVRSHMGLETAWKEVAALEREARNAMCCGSTTDVMRAFELMNLITTAKLVISGASARTESRGSQCREDFPETDDARWLRPIRTDE